MKWQVEESIWATIAGLVLPPALSDNLHILKEIMKSERLEIKIKKNVKMLSEHFQNDSSNYLWSGTATSKEAICWTNPSKCWNILASLLGQSWNWLSGSSNHDQLEALVNQSGKNPHFLKAHIVHYPLIPTIHILPKPRHPSNFKRAMIPSPP